MTTSVRALVRSGVPKLFCNEVSRPNLFKAFLLDPYFSPIQCFSVTKCPGPILKGVNRESSEKEKLTTKKATITVTTTINYDDDDTSTT